MHLHKNIYVKLQTKQTYKHTRGKCSNVYEHRNVSFKKQVYSSIVIVNKTFIASNRIPNLKRLKQVIV